MARPTTDPLTVGLVLDDGLDRPDGVQQYVLALAEGLTARGHEVHLVASSTRRTDLERLHVLGRHTGVSFNGNLLRTPLPAPRRAVRALLDAVPFDVLHVAMPYSPFLAGRLVAHAPADVAVVGTFLILTESRLVDVAAHGLGLLERRTLRRFDETLALSAPAAVFARRAFGLRSEVLGAPIDLERFRAAAEPGTADGTHGAEPAADGASGDPGAPVRLVFLGRLVERKGARELVAAVAHLHRHGLARRPWTLEIAGRGPLEPELRRTLEAAGLRGRVTLPGFVSEEDKPALLAGADLVVLPSTGGESFGVSVVEALACCRGVVLAGDNPGYRATMTGLEAQLVDPLDAPALAAALARWIDDPAGRAAAAGRQQRAARRFAAPVVVDAVEAVYRRALERRRPSGRPVGARR
ncbi:glycosyltransferase family 4 protein [Cellulomonas endophytica]|uniref:glycosyltransferase family 4 protein n=1 Tax=Cellulomonas endophytica TaxID=2494735 RepID=UPI0010137EF2|nr:glycosyltransferase family 4 protein [Cellulomonas endophytica]